MGSPRRLPVTVVTGFLGAGKTTLLRHLLLHSGQRLAVLVNEFGELGIDGELLSACGFCGEDELAGRLVELANGCLCCTVQEEFLPTMSRLLEQADSLDGIVVETSGLALPEPLVAAFGWPEIRARTRVHAVVTVVDGEALSAGHVVGDAAALEAQRQADPSLDHLRAIEDLFDDQLRAADLVLVSRADRLSATELSTLMVSLRRGLRAGTPVLPMARGAIDPELLLAERRGGPGPHDHAETHHHNDSHDQDDSHDKDHDHHHDHDHHYDQAPHHNHHHPHDQDHFHDQVHHAGDHEDHHDHSHVAMHAVIVRRSGSWQRPELERRLRALIQQEPVLRLKGRLQSPGRLPLQIQAVGPRLDCWFEGQRGEGEGAAEASLELVVLGAAADAERLERACAQI